MRKDDEDPYDDTSRVFEDSKPSQTKLQESPSREINALPLLFNTKMYIISDKNDIPALKELATRKYEKAVSKAWNHTIFSEAAELLWDNTVDSDRLLRGVVVRAAVINIRDLLDRGEFVELLNSHGEIGVDILKSVLTCTTAGDIATGGYPGTSKKKAGARKSMMREGW